MKIDRRILVGIFVLIAVAVSAFLGTLSLKPSPPDLERMKLIHDIFHQSNYDIFYENNYAAVTMQVYAGVTSIIAGFAIAAIILLVSRTRLPEEPNAQADNKRNLLDSTVSSFIGAFLTSIIAALLFASGGGQKPPDTDRAYSVMVSPMFVLALSISLLSLGVIMLTAHYKFKEALRTARNIYYISVTCLLLGFSIAVYEACFRRIDRGLLLFMILALSVGTLCFLFWRTYNKRKGRKFYERTFSWYLTACIICCLVSYALMTLYLEEQDDYLWLMPPLMSKSFLIVFSLLMGWSLTYIPARRE